MSFIEKSHNKLVDLIFPLVERFYFIVSLVLLVAAWSIPETYWKIRVVLLWLWCLTSDIYSSGIMERDYLPMQPGSSPFYHIYRFIDQVFFLLLLIWLVILLVPGSLWPKRIFLGMFFMAVILHAVGERKYRPKKPEE